MQESYKELKADWQEMADYILKQDKVSYSANISNYVDKADQFVVALQKQAERKLDIAIGIIVLSMLLIVALAYYGVWYTRRHVIRHLDKLVTASQQVQNRDFNHIQLATDEPNELGVFSRAFTEMADELSRFYTSLEDKVQDKTRRLTAVNRSLMVLYHCSQILTSKPINQSLLKQVLETVLNNGKVALEVYMRVFGDMLNHNDSLEEELGESLDKIYTLYKYVIDKFSETKEESGWLSSVDKRLRATKKMWYYSNILKIITPTLEMIRVSAVNQLPLFMLYAKDDKEKDLSDFNISLNNITTLIGILPSYVKSNTYIKEVPYGSKVLTIKEFCFGRSIFKEINGVLVSIEYDADKELTIEEQFATSVVGYEF